MDAPQRELLVRSFKSVTALLVSRQIGFLCLHRMSNPAVLVRTGCLGWTALFFLFIFLMSYLVCYWKMSMVKSSLLAKDEHLAPNIDKIMGVWMFRTRAQNNKKCKNWTSWFWFQFFKENKNGEILWNFFPTEVSALGFKTGHKNLVHKIS